MGASGCPLQPPGKTTADQHPLTRVHGAWGSIKEPLPPHPMLKSLMWQKQGREGELCAGGWPVPCPAPFSSEELLLWGPGGLPGPWLLCVAQAVGRGYRKGWPAEQAALPGLCALPSRPSPALPGYSEKVLTGQRKERSSDGVCRGCRWLLSGVPQEVGRDSEPKPALGTSILDGRTSTGPGSSASSWAEEFPGRSIPGSSQGQAGPQWPLTAPPISCHPTAAF